MRYRQFLTLKLINKLRKLTSDPSLELKAVKMDEAFLAACEGTKTPTENSPVKSSPENKTTFVGITPMKELTNIKTPTDRPFKVSVEGNIGAGKSTLIDFFKDQKGIEVYPEPLNWWRNLDGHNLLELLYSDIHKWHNTFQMYVQLSRLKVQTSQPSSPHTTVQMFERSIQNNRFCFVEQAYQNGYLHKADYSVLDQWYRWIRANVNINLDLIVYLRSTPEVVYERIQRRHRPEETEISLEYLKQLHDSHEQWLMSDNERFNSIPVLVLDADKTLEEITEVYRMNQNQILGQDKKRRISVDQTEKDKVRKALKL